MLVGQDQLGKNSHAFLMEETFMEETLSIQGEFRCKIWLHSFQYRKNFFMEETFMEETLSIQGEFHCKIWLHSFQYRKNFIATLFMEEKMQTLAIQEEFLTYCRSGHVNNRASHASCQEDYHQKS